MYAQSLEHKERKAFTFARIDPAQLWHKNTTRYAPAILYVQGSGVKPRGLICMHLSNTNTNTNPNTNTKFQHLAPEAFQGR
jgi:hypothetical protein